MHIDSNCYLQFIMEFKLVQRIAFALLAFSISGGLEAASLPSLIQIEITKKKDECKPDKVTLNDGFISKKDVNGDGIDDYVLDYGLFRCGEITNLYCGSAGCLNQVFVSTNSTYTKAFDDNVQDLVFKKSKGRPAMYLGYHGSECGKRGSQPCGAILYWNGSKFSPAN